MLRIGIVGAENTHSLAIARTLNVEGRIRGARVVAIWGETVKLAEERAEEGDIPAVVLRPEDMLGMVNAVIVDHRHGKYHLPAARPFLRAGLPLFIDKPFCCSLAEGKRFLAEARRRKVPVTGYGVLPLHRSSVSFAGKARKLGRILAASTSGPADLRSKYGGVFFYGIHQVELVLRTFGMDVEYTQVQRSGRGGTATLYYRSGMLATINLIPKGAPGFHICAVGEKGVLAEKIAHDPDPYLTGIKMFVRMFRTGRRPLSDREILGPVAVLEALARSVRTGSRERVARF